MRFLKALIVRLVIWVATGILVCGIWVGGKFDAPDRWEEF